MRSGCVTNPRILPRSACTPSENYEGFDCRRGRVKPRVESSNGSLRVGRGRLLEIKYVRISESEASNGIIPGLIDAYGSAAGYFGGCRGRER